MADQQFCLRWNNHQSTLISVFDSLQERGCMVDCTLAAEGKSLQAHKVVLSACSPYLQDLLSKHYDKHPILLLKDVTFEELKAIIDYMYRGEVNVAQDKLGPFLRAAESLQVKGLSESGGSEPPDTGGTTNLPSATKRTSKGIPVAVPVRSVEQKRQPNPPLEVQIDGASRDGSISPNLKKRRRQKGSHSDNGVELNDIAGNVPESHAALPASSPVPSKGTLPTEPTSDSSDTNLGLCLSLMENFVSTDDDEDANVNKKPAMPPKENVIKEKQEINSEILVQPKTEYLDEEEDDQDLTLEDDGMENSGYRAGPSHGRQSGYQSQGSNDQDEVFMAAQEAAGVNRDAQGFVIGEDMNLECLTRSNRGAGPGLFSCRQCGKVYRWRSNLVQHVKLQCGKHPQFSCVYCVSRYKYKSDLKKHILIKHPGYPVS